MYMRSICIERALFPNLAATIRQPSSEATFHWQLKPPDGTFSGTVYTDGSRLDGPHNDLARLGWAFVVIDSENTITAMAYGVPPRWIDSIPGAEAWAILQAAMLAEPGTSYKIDCQPCVTAIHKGRAHATAGHRPLARVFGLIFAAIDDADPNDFVWMPAHTKASDVGLKSLGDHTLLTEQDRELNGVADELAKKAVEEHRVPKELRELVHEQKAMVAKAAR